MDITINMFMMDNTINMFLKWILQKICSRYGYDNKYVHEMDNTINMFMKWILQ